MKVEYEKWFGIVDSLKGNNLNEEVTYLSKYLN